MGKASLGGDLQSRLRKVGPFGVAAALALGLLPMSSLWHPAEAAVAAGLTVAIGLVALLMPWDRLPSYVVSWPAYAYFVVIALLRDASGGAVSAYATLLMLPIFWLALHGTRKQLIGGFVAMAATLAAPIVLLGPPGYPWIEWRRVAIWIAVAPFVGLTVQSLVAEVKNRSARLVRLSDSMTRIARAARRIATSPDARYAICEQACALSEGRFALLAERDSSERVVQVAAAGAIPAAPGTALEDEASLEAAFSSRSSVFVPEPEAPAGDAPSPGERWALLYEPVVHGDKVIALLIVGWDVAETKVSVESRDSIRFLAAEAASAIERADLLARLDNMARIDALTGLPNRRTWDEELARHVAQARRDPAPLSLAMIDIDHFKRFNDENGHQAGDRLLKEAAAAWRAQLRGGDVVARYGGEEFAMLLPGCSLEAAAVVVERLRAATPGDETCSAGVAVWDGEEGGESLVRRADRALYGAKQAGRNRALLAWNGVAPKRTGAIEVAISEDPRGREET